MPLTIAPILNRLRIKESFCRRSFQDRQGAQHTRLGTGVRCDRNGTRRLGNGPAIPWIQNMAVPYAVLQQESPGVPACGKRTNSQVQIEPVVTDVNPDNIEQLIHDVDLVLDGTDNFETRLLINDACVKLDIPWVYGGVIATGGMAMAILPHRTPCFRCFLSDLPAPGSTPTCDTVGVLGTAATIVAAFQVTEALKLLTGQEEALLGRLLYLDAWTGDMMQFKVTKQDTPCPTCDLGQFEYLEAREGSWATSLCGRGAVQINVRREARVSFPQLAERLRPVGQVSFNDYMLRFHVNSYELTVFPDGRTIVKGCTDPALARTLYAKYIGL